MHPHDDSSTVADFTSWAPLLGGWDQNGSTATYLEPAAPTVPAGLLIGPHDLTSGIAGVTISFPEGEDPAPQGRIVFGYDPATGAHYSIGIGGYEGLYVLDQFVPERGYLAIRTFGSQASLRRDVDYHCLMGVAGQTTFLVVDDVQVLEANLPQPLQSEQLGLIAWGQSPVVFEDFHTEGKPPDAFVVMQFGEPYDALYEEVIAPVCIETGFTPIRADDMYEPGRLILQDIIQAIEQATVVIAEITPANQNVFYELGYAHALGKPTVLLAARGERLPFDISGFRCIFYDDSIGGKSDVEEQLRKHLQNL
jgi:hypothetical protein